MAKVDRVWSLGKERLLFFVMNSDFNSECNNALSRKEHEHFHIKKKQLTEKRWARFGLKGRRSVMREKYVGEIDSST